MAESPAEVASPLERGLRAAFGRGEHEEELPVPGWFGRYRIEGILGRGGMGVVYDAWQASPRRRVALKVIRPGLATKHIRRRFAREADLLARLTHPGISRILESGVVSEGGTTRSFVALECVEGVPLDAWARDASPTLGDRVKVMALVAEAVHHAHERSIVHRDLKPSNVLVQPDGTPKVLDFGVARVLAERETSLAATTVAGQLLGTLPYMSPEAFGFGGHDVDTRADVYALGCLLYEVLAERPAFDVGGRGFAAAVEAICLKEPLPLGGVQSRFRGDLETIAGKAMAKAPDARYPSAAAFAEDLRRFLDGQPILARPAGSIDRLRKVVKARLPRRAVATAGRLQRVAHGLLRRLPHLEAREERRIAAEQVEEARRALDRARSEGLIKASALEDATNPMLALLLARQAVRLRPTVGAITRLHGALQGVFLQTVLSGHDDEVRWVSFSPDGERILSGAFDGTARLWNREGRVLAWLDGHEGDMNVASFSADGQWIVTASEGTPARLWDAEGRLRATLDGHRGAVRSAAFSPDGLTVATSGCDGTARLWDLRGSPMRCFEGHATEVQTIAFSPDGELLLTAAWDGEARLWTLDGVLRAVLDSRADGRLGRSALKSPCGATFSPDGRLVLAWAEGVAPVLWTLEGVRVCALEGHDHDVLDAVFSPDGQRIVTGSFDSTARVWNREGDMLAVFNGHHSWVCSVAFAPDGRRIASASVDGTARIWTLRGHEQQVLRGHAGRVNQVTFGRDPRIVLTGSSDGTACLWDLDRGGLGVLRGHEGEVSSVRFSPAGDRILTASSDGTARVWDPNGRELVVLRGHDGLVRRAVFSPDGSRILTASFDGWIRLWDAEGRDLLAICHRGLDGGPLRPRMKHHWAYAVAFSPDGQRILTACSDRTARLWDLDGRPLAVWRGHDDLVLDASFAPDGARIVTGSLDATARVFDLEGAELVVLRGHERMVNRALFTPTGEQVLTASDDGTARLWNLDGTLAAVFHGHRHAVQEVAVSAEGDRVLTVSADGTARVWDLEGKPLVVYAGHRGRLRGGAFSPTGRVAVTASQDGTAHLWYTTAAEDVIALADRRLLRDFTEEERARYANLLGTEPGPIS